MSRGGPRPNSGRPKGIPNKNTRELIARAEAGGIMPLDVLLNDMRLFYNLGEERLYEARDERPGKEQARKFLAACTLKEVARQCARDVAPYLHPKLASIDATVNVTNVEAELAELE